ncbi:hypothetical protein [Rickettsia endosymbiont of Orchestes rusci]
MYTVIAKPRSGCGNLSYNTMIFTRCYSREKALLHGWLKSLKTCHTVA